MAINSKPILVSKMQEAHREGRGIVAGKLMLEQPDSGHVNDDPLQLNDPWKKPSAAKQTVAPATATGAWDGYKGTGTTKNPTMPRPTESILKTQSQRITTLETDLQEIKTQIAQSDRANQAQFTQLKGDITTMSNTLRSSLETALQDQSSQLIRTFESLMRTNGGPAATDKTDGSRSRSPVRTTHP